ncbi:hypothetical protein EDB86DRAFT_2942512 [Lactarius hatsudake]|nr:hypothetical protein EDB86DRAFT_2942512 [Lactarius hatsudake]
MASGDMVRSGSSSPTWSISLMISFTLSEFLVVSLSDPVGHDLRLLNILQVHGLAERGRNRTPLLPVCVRDDFFERRSIAKRDPSTMACGSKKKKTMACHVRLSAEPRGSGARCPQTKWRVFHDRSS